MSSLPCFYACREGQEPNFYGDRTNTTVWYATAKKTGVASTVVGNGILVSDGQGNGIFISAKPPKGKKVRRIRTNQGDILYLQGDTDTLDVWHVGREHKPEHPTEKPSELARRAIENSSVSGDVVLDVFAGSGRMMVAAEQTGRKAFMIEQDPSYAAVILETASKMGIKPMMKAEG